MAFEIAVQALAMPTLSPSSVLEPRMPASWPALPIRKPATIPAPHSPQAAPAENPLLSGFCPGRMLSCFRSMTNHRRCLRNQENPFLVGFAGGGSEPAENALLIRFFRGRSSEVRPGSFNEARQLGHSLRQEAHGWPHFQQLMYFTEPGYWWQLMVSRRRRRQGQDETKQARWPMGAHDLARCANGYTP